MSQHQVRGFFPAVSNIVDMFIPGNELFPDDVAHLCPEPSISLSVGGIVTTVVRNPILGLGAILGIIIGFAGHNHFSRRVDTRYKPYSLWADSFLHFGLMNITGLLVHVLLPTFDDLYADTYPFLWVLDCYFTGCSSINMIRAVLLSYPCEETVPRWKPSTTLYLSNGLFSLAMIAFLVGTWGNIPFRTLSIELFYLLPVECAFFAMVPAMVQLDGGYIHSLICALSTSIFVAGILLDAKLCRLTEGAFLDSFMTGTWAFLACDIGFLNLWIWLDAREASHGKRL